MKQLVVIEDATIRALLNDPRAVALLPCLKGPKRQLASVKPGGKNCSSCRNTKNKLANSAMQTARDCIKSSRGDRLSSIKKHLNAKQLRLVARNKKGHRVNYTI